LPRHLSAGVSDGTERKLRDFERLQYLHAVLWRTVRERGGNGEWIADRYHYVDLNSGPGMLRLPTGKWTAGSPLLFVRNMEYLELPWKAWMCEWDKRSHACLAEYIDHAGVSERCSLFARDHRGAAPDIIAAIHASRRGRKAMGLIYADPNGTLAREEMDTAARIAAEHPKMDILMHLAANTFKRCRAVFGYASFTERLAALGKKRLLVREPQEDYQWTFVLLTDWERYPDWRSCGFYGDDTPEFQEIMEALLLAKWQRRLKGQARLW
jgi:hypothetical protein